MIPVNLITGFLGTGKTSLIRHLLQQHSGDERWGVLVNEFGDVGIDGALLQTDGVAIEEVAGGCLCCVAAPAFTIGLNRLIREQRPERLLIEPSGLGHPAQVLETLSSPLYSHVLELQATLCVMDARHLSSARHREHPNFIDQIHVADILVANKTDLYSADDKKIFEDFVADLKPAKSRLLWAEHGAIDAACLSEGHSQRSAAFPEAHAFLLQHETQTAEPLGAEWLCIEGHADGYFQAGWRIPDSACFERTRLVDRLNKLPQQRVKGILRCSDGFISYNRSEQSVEITDTAMASESRLQLIDSETINCPATQTLLQQCLVNDAKN